MAHQAVAETMIMAEQATHLIANLSEESAKAVLDFARFLSYRGKLRQTIEVGLD